MHKPLSRSAKAELLAALRQRYQQSPKKDKARILDEFVAVAGCHRKHAIRLLAGTATVPADGTPAAAADRRTYDEAVRQAVIVLWEAADRICGKRLKAVLPRLLAALEGHGHLTLDPAVRQRVLAASPATLDRLLSAVRRGTNRRKKRKVPSKPSQQVPVRTFADWKEPVPGYVEIDFVAHGGSSMQGAFLWSLVATDVCSGWTEVVPLLAREQTLVVTALGVLRQQFPMPILGIDTDNDSAFINETLIAYCRDEGLQFTRSRPYQKNDQAWIEQKNGSVVRRFVGYERFAGIVAGQCLAGLFHAVRLYINHFQPSMKLRSKTRVGAKVKKVYFPPTTPSERLCGHAGVVEATKESLRAEASRLNPLELLQRIRASQSALAALSSGELGSGPDRQSLDEFLAALPELWRQGEARPTHRQTPPKPRMYRTRKDPFEGVWAEILLWLQEAPEATGKDLLQKLDQAYPGRFSAGQLRTLQRRIREWRRVVAQQLVQVCLKGHESRAEPVVVGAKAAE